MLSPGSLLRGAVESGSEKGQCDHRAKAQRQTQLALKMEEGAQKLPGKDKEPLEGMQPCGHT